MLYSRQNADFLYSTNYFKEQRVYAILYKDQLYTFSKIGFVVTRGGFLPIGTSNKKNLDEF
jgi:hypothetical protein